MKNSKQHWCAYAVRLLYTAAAVLVLPLLMLLLSLEPPFRRIAVIHPPTAANTARASGEPDFSAVVISMPKISEGETNNPVERS